MPLSVTAEPRLMAHFSRFGPFLLVCVLGVAALPACTGREGGPDRDPPEFAGLESAVALAPGTAQLTWQPAVDPSQPVRYRVWTAAAPGGEPFDQAPVAETEDTSLVLTGLPTGATPTYFVVRARDARGNEDGNLVERGVQFTENRLSLLGEYDLSIASDIAVSATNDVVALGSFETDPQVRAYLFDVSDPEAPALLHAIYGEGRSTDVEIRGNVLWVATEFDPDDHGAYAYDITDPEAPLELGALEGPGLAQCHTIWLDGTLLFCASSDDGTIRIVDVTDPAAPEPKGMIEHPSGRIHDMYVDGDFAVGAFLWGGFAFFELSDPDNPTLLEQVSYPGAMTHNVWPSTDRTHLFTTDETTGGHLRVWDISDRAAITQVAEYIADPGPGPHAIVHNVQVQGDLAYVAWYEAGVQVLDVSEPAAPLLVGWQDTYPGPTEGWFAGAWSAAPKGSYVYVSDFSAGLKVMRLEDESAE